MFVIQSDKTICVTRGDIANIVVSASAGGGAGYVFAVGDVVRFKVFERKSSANVVILKDVTVEEETETVTVNLTGQDTKIGDFINKPTDYWYEIELNPDTQPQTIIGYDEDGEKIFRLYPEGGDSM